MNEQDLLTKLKIKEDYILHNAGTNRKYDYDVDVSWTITNVALKNNYTEIMARVEYRINNIDIYSDTDSGIYNIEYYDELIFNIKNQDILDTIKGIEINAKLYNPKVISRKLTEVEYIEGVKFTESYIDKYYNDVEMDYENNYIFINYCR